VDDGSESYASEEAIPDCMSVRKSSGSSEFRARVKPDISASKARIGFSLELNYALSMIFLHGLSTLS